MKENTPIEAHHSTKKIFLVFTLMFFSIFLVGTVSSFEWDNIGSYNEETKTMTIINALGFGEDIAEIKLLSPLDNHVPLGYGEVARFEIKQFSDYNEVLKELELFDKRKENKKFIRNYDYKVLTYENVTIEDYGQDLVTGKYRLDGTHTEIKEIWTKLNETNFKKNDVLIIGIFTDVKQGDVVEWIPNIMGIRIDKWAVWTADLNVDLNHYYKLNNTNDELLTANLTNNGGVTFTEGLIGLNANGGVINSGKSLSTSDTWGIDGGVMSMSVWVNATASPTVDHGIVGTCNTASDVCYFLTYDDGGGTPLLRYDRLRNGVAGGLLTHTVTLPINGSYQHIVIAYDGAISYLYFNGVLVDSAAFSGNGSTNPTGGSRILDNAQIPGTFFNGKVDEVGIWGRNLTGSEVTQLFNSGVGITFTDVFVPTVTLNSPIDFFNTTNLTIIFNATIGGTVPDNVTLFIDDVGNETNSTGILDHYIFTKEIAEGIHTWNVQACNLQGCANGTERTFTIDQSSPTLNITFPTEIINFHEINTNLFVNWTVSDLLLDTCILQFEEVNTTVTCNDNQTEINITNIVNRTIIFYANDTFGNVNSSTRTWDYLTFQNAEIFNASTFETASEIFLINITTNGTAPTDASLIYNGTEFTGAAIISLGGNDYNISRTIDIPLIEGSNTLFNFDFTIANTEISSNSKNQEVNLTTFEFCEVGTQPAYINFTFTNETVAEETITAEIDTTWNFWLGSGTVIDSLIFSNITENLNYQFCLTSGGNRTLNANVSLSYDNALSQLRRFTQTYSLTNTTTTQNLFLLPTAEGIFVTFQVVDPAEQVISGVSANVTKGGNLISSGITDDAGLITYFLDPDTTYIFSFSKTGLTTVTTTLVPTQTSFTIIMGIVTTISQFDTTRGINYIINPIDLTLTNDTLVNFNLTFSSSFHSLEQFGFVLKNSTGTIFNITTSTTDTGGFLSQILDTGSNTDIIMEVFWTITGNQTNVTRIWLVFNLENEGFSILTFFNDLTTFTNSDLFGLTDFGLGIIVFLIILVSTGIVSVKFGLTSPPGISIIVFSLVAFFDVALGIIPNPINAIPNFPTIFVGLIFLGTLYSEAIK